MFLHHTMSDREILRSCEGCTSQHLRLVADRLRVRVDGMREIAEIARNGIDWYELHEIYAGLDRIAEIADNKGD